MTTREPLHPAEERLLDAALAQHFAGTRTVAPATHRSRWLAAALLLLGLGVVAATMWQVRQAPTDEIQEPEPAPLPPEVTGDGKTQLAALPATVPHLFAKFVDPRDLPVLTRFTALRGLRLWAEKIHVAGINTGQYHGRWSSPPDDLLQPLAGLHQLEVLKLPRDLVVTPTVLAPLAGHPTLRELQLVGSLTRGNQVVDAALVEALAAIPKLRALHLMFVRIDGDVLPQLAKLPLESLELEWCNGLDAKGWAALLSMRGLRRLSFKDWDWHTDTVAKEGPRPWRPQAADLRRLHELPQLRTLELMNCGLRDDELAALPDTLHALVLLGHELSPAGYAHLQRFAVLRRLDLGLRLSSQSLFVERQTTLEQAATADAAAAALKTLRLRMLRCVGELSPALREAIAAQRDLSELSIVSDNLSDLPALGALKKLERLRLAEQRQPGGLTLDLLRPLRDLPALRELEVHAHDVDDAAVKALFGERVAVKTSSWKTVPKR